MKTLAQQLHKMKPVLRLSHTPRPNDSSADASAEIGSGLTNKAVAPTGQPSAVPECVASPGISTAPVAEAHQIALYEAARRDLAEAQDVSEVKNIHDRMAGFAEYARKAKKTELIESAVDMLLRAARRAGEMLIETKLLGHRDNGKGNRNPDLKSRAATPKLADLGISKSQSSRWQRMARLTPEEFEFTVEQGKRKALSAIDRTVKPVGEKQHSNPSGVSDLRRVRTAIKFLCAVPSGQELAVGDEAGPNLFSQADIARAIEFLQELQSALATISHP